MEQERIPRPGDIYRHYSNKLYQIITLAMHTKSNELLVVYQALYDDFRVYARPLASFNSEIDKEKHPQAMQKYKFELVKSADIAWKNYKEFADIKPVLAGPSHIEPKSADMSDENNAVREYESSDIKQDNRQDFSDMEAASVLLNFLEADSFSKKLDIVLSGKKHLNDRLINDMSVALDCTVEDGPLDERIESLVNCLQALCRFENKRLR